MSLTKRLFNKAKIFLILGAVSTAYCAGGQEINELSASNENEYYGVQKHVLRYVSECREIDNSERMFGAYRCWEYDSLPPTQIFGYPIYILECRVKDKDEWENHAYRCKKEYLSPAKVPGMKPIYL